MFGKGGSLTKLWNDNQIVIPPITIAEAKSTIRQTKSFQLIKGFRGMTPVDEDLIIEHLQKLGQLLLDFPQIKEIDINPLVWADNKLIALDASILLK